MKVCWGALMEPGSFYAVQEHEPCQQQEGRELDRSRYFALLPAYVKVLDSKWVLIPKVTVSACLHCTPCPPTIGISTGERHLSSVQSLFTF